MINDYRVMNGLFTKQHSQHLSPGFMVRDISWPSAVRAKADKPLLFLFKSVYVCVIGHAMRADHRRINVSQGVCVLSFLRQWCLVFHDRRVYFDVAISVLAYLDINH